MPGGRGGGGGEGRSDVLYLALFNLMGELFDGIFLGGSSTFSLGIFFEGVTSICTWSYLK